MNDGPFKVYLSAYHSEVTGSRLLVVVEYPDKKVYRILVDCGFFQEIAHQRLNYVNDINPENIDAIVITHNHIDHTGLIPKFVHNGYSGPIYMTEITAELCLPFLYDSCKQQTENISILQKMYPDEAYMFHQLYSEQDVNQTSNLIHGIPYQKTIEVFPGIELTFLGNGHLLGSAMVVLTLHCHGKQTFGIFFTGDYRLKNCFYNVPPIPEWVKKMPLVMVHESTYGTTNSTDVKKCFKDNILKAFAEKKDILIGAFAQGRMQELLYDFKLLQESGLIPEDYTIYVDGPLGIKTTRKYKAILSWYNPEKADFIPNNVSFVKPDLRESILNSKSPKVIITTSGMLSNGPARTYVPFFLARNNAVIHLTGYAAEGTLARALLDAKHDETVRFNSQVFKKSATILATQEKSSHATADEMIGFIRQFSNIAFLALNHGEANVKIEFANRILNETDISRVEILDRNNMFVIYQNAPTNAKYVSLYIKRLPAKLGTVGTKKHVTESRHKKTRSKNVLKRNPKRK